MAGAVSEQVSISSDDSSSDEDDMVLDSKELSTTTNEMSFAEVMLRRAQMYQEYMKRIPIPMLRGSVVPFNSWTELGASLKQLYKQPLHYLTNIRLKQLDNMRVDASDDDAPLDITINPYKAEASIWLMEEVHRFSSSHHYLAKLWLEDGLYHAFIDPVFHELQKSSH